MHQKIKHCAAAIAGAAALMGPATGMACTLKPADLFRIKQMMAVEIAHRLGLRPQQVPLQAITQPVLHSPLALEADCGGLDSYHYSAAFRIGVGSPSDPGAAATQPPMRWGQYAREPSTTRMGRKREPSAGPDAAGAGLQRWSDMGPSMGRWPQHERCAYEGVAVVLGYGYSSPVAVNFKRKCR
ncbi:hypothetical protein [Pantoea sp. 18069]|uniref:hypothetical protein n=1 Tax=Pantoea sp. 18069 TaxID=2681415 RepID=UPI0013592909|nr:hypothetical protein [Pantoea sp. 18069]